MTHTTTTTEVPMSITSPVHVGIRCMDSVETIPGNGSLIVQHIHYGKDALLEDVIAHTAEPVEVTLTADGRHYDRTGWHTGPEAEWVRVERWSTAGREFHGFIDATSRKLVQAG